MWFPGCPSLPCSACCRTSCASVCPFATQSRFSKRLARPAFPPATRCPTEYVCQSIRRAVKPYLNRAGDLHAWFIDPALEQAVESAVEHSEQNSHLSLPPQQIQES